MHSNNGEVDNARLVVYGDFGDQTTYLESFQDGALRK